MVHIAGHKIKVEGDGPEEGLWFVAAADGARTQVSETLGLNRPVELMALVPALTPGKYRLEIVTRYTHGGTPLKEPRTIKAEPELTVAPTGTP
jgi:hypothetical protein